MTDYYEQIDQDGAGHGRVHETRSAGASVQSRRVWADDQTNTSQAQDLKHTTKQASRAQDAFYISQTYSDKSDPKRM